MGKGYDVTPLQLKTPLLIAAPKSLWIGRMKSHLHEDLDPPDNETCT